MVGLDLDFLGGYQGRLVDGGALALPSKKGWALLAYLALHPDQAIRRERLAALLWGDRFEEQARGSLRQTLYEIRGALGEGLADCIEANRTTVALTGKAIRVDALRFETLVSSGESKDLAEAAALYRGPLLEGLETGEPAFEEWLGGERARFQGLSRRCLEAQATQQLQQGDGERAIATARRLVALEPLYENGHQLLMKALAKSGRRSEALKHYQELTELLHAELKVQPSAATQELRASLLAEAGEGGRATAQTSEATMSPGADNTSLGSLQERRRWPAITAVLAVILAIGIGLTAWQVSRPDFEPADVEKMAYPLPDKPSIAVLPFENFGGEQQDEFIAKGLTEDIITALAKIPELFVISRSSSFAFKDQPVTASEVAEELGVRYLLEGSIQHVEDSLRVNAQLIDAVEGHHLWAENFDGAAADLFAFQDEIVRQITIALELKLTFGDIAEVASRGTTNLDAWLLRAQAATEVYKFTRESTARARELFEAASRLDPNWARPLAGLAWSYWWEARRGWTENSEGWIRKGVALAEKAIEMDPEEPLGYMQLGNLRQFQGDHEQAIALREKAVEIAPNDMAANWGLGSVYTRAGQAERGVELLKRAERLAPRHPASLTWSLSHAQLFAGQYEDAIETAKRVSARVPDHSLPYFQLTLAHSFLGQSDAAQSAFANFLRIEPNYTIAQMYREHGDYKDQTTVDKFAELLRQAGLPD